MAPHSSTLAWKIPWAEEPGRLQSMGSLRVGHDWATSLSLFTFHFHALEKEMATHSSVLAWRIPGTGEPVGLPSMGSHRVGHTEVIYFTLGVYFWVLYSALCIYLSTLSPILYCLDYCSFILIIANLINTTHVSIPVLCVWPWYFVCVSSFNLHFNLMI